jgi:hypothetical protein
LSYLGIAVHSGAGKDQGDKRLCSRYCKPIEEMTNLFQMEQVGELPAGDICKLWRTRIILLSGAGGENHETRSNTETTGSRANAGAA